MKSSKKIKRIYTLDEAENGNFGIRLIYLRQKNKMSQSQLALLINTKPSTISQYEANLRKPVSNILLKIAELFNVTSEWLINGINFKNQNSNLDGIYNNLEMYYKVELMKYAKYLLYRQEEKNKSDDIGDENSEKI